jgi:hypothetical protein
MKKVLLIWLILVSCSSQRKVINLYVLNKEKKTSYYLSLNIKSDHRYTLKTISTGASGETDGNWKINHKTIILIPDKAKYEYIKFGDSIIQSEKYRPFADTLYFLIKKNKLIKISKDKNKFVLYKIRS